MDLYYRGFEAGSPVESSTKHLVAAAARLAMAAEKGIAEAPGKAGEQLRALLTTKNLATVGFIFAVWVIFTIVGGPLAVAVDTILAGLGLLSLAERAIETAASLKDYATTAYYAEDGKALEKAGGYFASAMATIGVTALELVIGHKSFKAAREALTKRGFIKQVPPASQMPTGGHQSVPPRTAPPEPPRQSVPPEPPRQSVPPEPPRQSLPPEGGQSVPPPRPAGGQSVPPRPAGGQSAPPPPTTPLRSSPRVRFDEFGRRVTTGARETGRKVKETGKRIREAAPDALRGAGAAHGGEYLPALAAGGVALGLVVAGVATAAVLVRRRRRSKGDGD